MTVEVYALRLSDAPSEVWYGVKANGQDLRAGWADPEAARRAGERHIRELRERLSKSSRGGTKMETETPETPATPDVEPEEEPKLPEPDEDEDGAEDEDAKAE